VFYVTFIINTLLCCVNSFLLCSVLALCVRAVPIKPQYELKMTLHHLLLLFFPHTHSAGVSRAAALRIIVIEGLFKPSDFLDPTFSDELETDIASECEKCGTIEKLTFFSSNPRGIAVVKFGTSYAAQECIRLMNGRFFAGTSLCFTIIIVVCCLFVGIWFSA